MEEQGLGTVPFGVVEAVIVPMEAQSLEPLLPPVAPVKAEPPLENASTNRLKLNIVVACDGSELGMEAVRRAYELANPEKDKVCVVAVLEKRRDRKINMGKMGKMFQKQNTAEREERMEPDPRLYEKRKQVEQMLSFVTTGMPQAQAFKGRVSYRVEEGDPRELIIFAAIAENADYIVVGEKGDGDVKHQRIGATTDYLVRHAPCSVVVVKTLCEE